MESNQNAIIADLVKLSDFLQLANQYIVLLLRAFKTKNSVTLLSCFCLPYLPPCCLCKRRKHLVLKDDAHFPFMNKISRPSTPPRPTTILSHCLLLLAQTSLLSTWIILVLRRRAHPATAAAEAAVVATVLLQVSM